MYWSARVSAKLSLRWDELLTKLARLKIHIPELPDDLVAGELKHVLIGGVSSNPRTQFCDEACKADYIFLDSRHVIKGVYDARYANKTVIVDYRDGVRPLLDQPALFYFKRSVVDKKKKRIVRYRREVYPIAYCIKNDYLPHAALNNGQRDLDIAVFFNPSTNNPKVRNKYRIQIADFVANEFGRRPVHVGLAGAASKRGRNQYNEKYHKLLTRAKIVVTANPDHWEGDYRLFESLFSGCLVFVDEMLTPVIHPFSTNEHLVYYDRDDLPSLKEKIEYYLNHPAELCRVAESGHRYAMSFHTASARIDEIIAVLVNTRG